jgi:hypothetical protein
MECPFRPECDWGSVSWTDNAGRELAAEQWRVHKAMHTRFGPVFVRERCVVGALQGYSVHAGLAEVPHQATS